MTQYSKENVVIKNKCISEYSVKQVDWRRLRPESFLEKDLVITSK